MGLAGSSGFVNTFVHLRAMLAGSTALDWRLDDALERTDTHTALSVARERVMSSEGVATQTRIWLGARMNLGMSLEVVATNEALVAVVALELSVAQMGLYMGLDVLFAAEALVAVLVPADPLVVAARLGAFNELSNIVNRDVGLLNRGFDSRLEIEIRDRHTPRG
jgi:hypothetical protein